jgi:hypothetical protein
MSARICMAIVVTATVSLAAGSAAAQVYRCSNGSSTYLSDRPCSGSVAPPTSNANRATFGAGGPQPQRPTYTSDYHPSMAKAPEHLRYLSPECASLNDAIRTGPARGLRSAAMSDLHNEYRAKCAEEESEAYQKLSRERGDQRLARRQELAAQQAEQQRSVREREQCAELLRILQGKRQRLATMSAGEKADFEHSESAYHARCDAR